MIIDKSYEIASPPLFFQIKDWAPFSLFLKLEGLNIAGSIKLVSALGMIEALEKSGKVSKDTVFIESSSGNLGVALSIICKSKGYPFICISDPNILPGNETLIKAYGGEMIKVTQRDKSGGFLGTRIALIQQLLEENAHFIWVNQYENLENPNAHYQKTGQDILDSFGHVDYLFIGAGTTGTLMGCARFFREKSPHTRIVAVDVEGSVTFSDEPKKRFVPGLGTSKRPPIANRELVDDILHIPELQGIEVCQKMLEEKGLLLGGSSGIVLQGVLEYSSKISPGSCVVALSPDFGEKYLDTVYQPKWVESKFFPSKTALDKKIESPG